MTCKAELIGSTTLPTKRSTHTQLWEVLRQESAKDVNKNVNASTQHLLGIICSKPPSLGFKCDFSGNY